MTKESAPEELVGAIRRVLRGGRYISPSLAERLAVGVEQKGEQALSDREYEVMLKIASGRTVGEIAAELGLSVKTVSTYRARVLEKMGMRTNAELTRFAIQKRLVD